MPFHDYISIASPVPPVTKEMIDIGLGANCYSFRTHSFRGTGAEYIIQGGRLLKKNADGHMKEVFGFAGLIAMHTVVVKGDSYYKIEYDAKFEDGVCQYIQLAKFTTISKEANMLKIEAVNKRWYSHSIFYTTVWKITAIVFGNIFLFIENVCRKIRTNLPPR